MNMAALLAGLLSGLIGAMGLGGGAVLVMYLAVFTSTDQLTSQGINLIFFIPIATLAVIIYAIKRQLEWKKIIPLAIGGIIGAFGGLAVASVLGGGLMEKISGALLIALGLKEIFSKNKKTKE